MPTLADIRSRIKSIKSTQHITRAMKMIAQARLLHWRDLMLHRRSYAKAIETVVANLALRLDTTQHRLLAIREENRQIFLVITADRGLCGAFNSNVIKVVEEMLERAQEAEVILYLIGKKGVDYFRRRQYPIDFSSIDIFRKLSLSQATSIAARVLKQFKEEKIDSLYLIYNQFVSLLRQKVVVKKLLPILRAEPPKQRAIIDYIYELRQRPILEKLVPLYVVHHIYLALLESYAAEHAARMIAMESATNNAEKLVQQQTLTLNKLRQAQITKEILDIIGTSEALGSKQSL